MGVIAAALNGNRVTDARLTIPAWGVSYHDVSIDGEVTLTGAVTLQVADLTIQGTVLSGGPAAGRSFYRIVAGAGGWGKTIPAKSYANDAGVKLSTVLGDAAAECGETIDTTSFDTTTRLGSYFTRPEDQACRVLELVRPGAWYVGEDGRTRLGARPAGALTASAAQTSQIDRARGTVTLASETLAAILPGLVVDGLTVVDVEHTVDGKGGLRSKLWAKQSTGGSRELTAFRSIFEALDPGRAFRGIYEYRVVTQEGERLNLQPVQVSTGMPSLSRVLPRPGVPGCKATHALGSRVLVAFVNADPARPVVVAFEDAEGPGFSPSVLFASGGGAAATEHVATAEFVALLVYNVLAAIVTANTGPLVGATLQSLIAGYVSAALATMATPAPPGLAAQIAAAAAQAGNFATGAPAYTCAPFSSAIAAAAAAKTDDVSGLFPAAGCKALQSG